MWRTLNAPAVPPAHKAAGFAALSVRPLPHFDTEGYGSTEAANEANSRADIREAVMLAAALRARTQGSEKLVRRLNRVTLAIPPFAEMARHLVRSWASRAELIDHLDASWPEYNLLYAHPFTWSWTRSKMHEWVVRRLT